MTLTLIREPDDGVRFADLRDGETFTPLTQHDLQYLPRDALQANCVTLGGVYPVAFNWFKDDELVDHDDIGAREIKSVIENAHYPNHCISPEVMQTESRLVEWDDDHPLNDTRGAAEAFKKLFGIES